MNRYLRQFVRETVQRAWDLRSGIASLLRSDIEGRNLRTIHSWVNSATGSTASEDDFVDLYAQAVACSAAVFALASNTFRQSGVVDWLRANSSPLWQAIWDDSLTLWAGSRTDVVDACGARRSKGAGKSTSGQDARSRRDDPIIHFYESFLGQYDPSRRRSHGVFYTPAPIAKYIVKQIHRSLRDDFDLADGLADPITWGEYAQCHDDLIVPDGIDPQSPFVRILDPAVGTGAFLVEAVDQIHGTLRHRWTADGCSADEVKRRWNAYVTGQLLPRIFGLELMLPACAVARLKLVDKLAATGFSFDTPARLEIHLTNTLVGPERQLTLFDASTDEVRRAIRTARDVSYATPFTVVVGNPPFSGISDQQGKWITDLLRGKSLVPGDCANYYEVDGRPLAERKHWLQDDYVKFMRYAHWTIETAGCGIVGLISNHGYLDNPTFRGMRQQLMRTFSRITIVDLHGNRKKKERAPRGGVDENVFAIEQGTAIGLFLRLAGAADRCEVRHAELWGKAGKKLAALSTAGASTDSSPKGLAIPTTTLVPRRPDFVFAPRDDALRREYERGYRLTEIMPVNVTAPVTARDRFVVAFCEEELIERIEQFRDLSTPDAEIRRRFFTNTRSTKYPPGDTRGWKLPAARRRLAEDESWRDYIRPCWYRAFDRRVIYWADWMIDWPRGEVMRHILAGENIALIARRQMLPTQPCNYFWITDSLTLDGVIRSDSRGSESVFPLYLYAEHKGNATCRRANFAEPFIAEAGRTLGLDWIGDGAGDLRRSFGPEDLVYYCYALFSSPTYRERYAETLRVDFPRIFLPHDSRLFCTLREIGARLAAAHLLLASHDSRFEACRLTVVDSHGCRTVGRGFPRYRESRVLLHDRCWFDNVPQDVWDFHAGGHQVCKKWLKDRRGRTLSDTETTRYRQIVASLTETLHCMGEIEETIMRHGGWPRAFV